MRTLDSSQTPYAKAAMTSARLVKLFEPGGVIVALKGFASGSIVTSLMA